MKKNNINSRRDFLKQTSITGVGAIALTEPLLAFFADKFKLTPEVMQQHSLTCDLIRAADMMHLKFFLFNAKMQGEFLKRAFPGDLFVYVQLPPQHIAEPLVSRRINGRADFEEQKSFLASRSRLAFKLPEDRKMMLLTPDNLLNWNENFQLVTIDDFALLNDGNRTNYSRALDDIKKEFRDLNTPQPEMNSWHNNFAGKNTYWPLTKFEIPYKMFLSPIADPNVITNFSRKQGNFEFKESNLKETDHLEEGQENFRIISPWENRLVFRTLDNHTSDPRFKVVHFLCQHSSDNDRRTSVGDTGNYDLLPAPIHREELSNLTMLQEFDRDVLSTLFKISTLGGTANLKYKNDDPKSFSTVAWEQKIKYGRDNYINVTFRAVDVFTGLKLRVSIIGERTYAFGVSYLPKLYFVSYAESDKDYSLPETLSRLPFKKIIPQTKGAYFIPNKVTGTENAYHVTKDTTCDNTTWNCDNQFVFDYIGIDKAGKEHKFQSKIIFIPAEQHIIRSGIFPYGPGYPAGRTVGICDIGYLDPAFRIGQTGGPACPPDNASGENYRFETVKTFSYALRARLASDLQIVKRHVDANLPCYQHLFNSDITYARLDGLKVSKKVVIQGKQVEVSPIRKDSTNGTFRTRELLLFVAFNPKINNDTTINDGMLLPNPVLGSLDFSYVIISQVDQIEGQSVYRKVVLADDYINGQKEIDADDPGNPAKLLFELRSDMNDFFTKNYRRGGAVVNPGIDITHISVRDQSIAYKPIHNKPGNKFYKAGASNLDSVVAASTIFNSSNAKILDIPIIKIIGQSIPVADIPALNYIQRAEEAITKLQQLQQSYQGIIDDWLAKYRTVQNEIQQYRRQLSQLDELIANAAGKAAKAWIESMVEQSGSRDYYNAIGESANVVNQFKDKVLKPVAASIDPGNIIKSKLDTLVAAPTVVTLHNLLETAINLPVEPQRFLEVVKYYLVNNLNNPDVHKAVLQVLSFSEQISTVYVNHFNALSESYQQARQMVEGVVKEQIKVIDRQISQAKAEVSAYIESLLPKDFIKKKLQWLLKLYEIAAIYDHYHSLYESFKKEEYLKLNIISAPDLEKIYSDLETELIKVLRQQANAINLPSLPDQALQTQLINFKKSVNDALKNNKNWFTEYAKWYGEFFQELINDQLKPYQNIIVQINQTFEQYRAEWDKISALLNNSEALLRNFLHDRIAVAMGIIEDEKRRMMNRVTTDPLYREAQNKISQLQELIRKMKEISKQRLEYTYTTSNFQSATVGVVSFTPNKTELKVNVVYELEFEIADFDRPPAIKRSSFITDSSLTNFKLGVLQILFIDFAKVRFVSGSDVKDDFQVHIRDVQFAGCLSFVEAFQEYLKSISDNLVFDIDAAGARIGYGFSLPDFSAGYFNFYNFNLSALLTLPFDPKRSMQIQFGFGSPLNKFGLTMSGIFGGQGYFNLIAEPKRGIVAMEIVLEFGAIFRLNLGLANGTAYVVGGIYIKRWSDGTCYTKMYILAVGRFNIIGLFSAGLSFYMGVEGYGNVLEGVCTVTASKRFSRFFEISVSCTMRKTIVGTKRPGSQQQQLNLTSAPPDSALAAENEVTAEEYYGSYYY